MGATMAYRGVAQQDVPGFDSWVDFPCGRCMGELGYTPSTPVSFHNLKKHALGRWEHFIYLFIYIGLEKDLQPST